MTAGNGSSKESKGNMACGNEREPATTTTEVAHRQGGTRSRPYLPTGGSGVVREAQ